MDAPAGFRHPSQKQGRSRSAKSHRGGGTAAGGRIQGGPTQLFDDTSTQPPPQPQPDYYDTTGAEPGYDTSVGMATPGSMSNVPYSMNDPMANMAMQYGASLAGQTGEMLEKNVDRFISVSKLKYYFAVDTAYVGKKLALLSFPFTHTNWSIHYNNQDEPVAPRYEINAPDLYIPVMAFVTYLLVAGYVLGTQNRFDPEQLGMQASSGLIWLVIELAIIVLSLYIMNLNTQLRTLDLVAFCGYKYVGMIMILLSGLCFNSLGYYIMLLYMGTCIVFFLMKTLKVLILSEANPHSVVHGRKRGTYILVFIAAMQPLFMYWLTSHLSTFKEKID
ncbi:protein YIF1B-like [Saccoglossus kowalevskii]|uniref:Protein YIF1 n=1 Tax=Saccoglossus kowalevskii TaxID=10224 RepID=A0ABM0GMS8_SACKO|nr:PREDICTED: protein YIF1B-like isoform X1 [Saccoglossus kowalevskii]